LRAQICFEEALKLSKKEFEGAKSRRREKKGSKKLSRELQEAPEELRSHDPRSLPTDYELRRSRSEPPRSSQRAPEELLESRNGARRGPEELSRGAEELRDPS